MIGDVLAELHGDIHRQLRHVLRGEMASLPAPLRARVLRLVCEVNDVRRMVDDYELRDA